MQLSGVTVTHKLTFYHFKCKAEAHSLGSAKNRSWITWLHFVFLFFCFFFFLHSSWQMAGTFFCCPSFRLFFFLFFFVRLASCALAYHQWLAPDLLHWLALWPTWGKEEEGGDDDTWLAVYGVFEGCAAALTTTGLLSSESSNIRPFFCC